MYYDEDRVPFDQLDEIIIGDEEKSGDNKKNDKINTKKEATV
jgi:hypothetical protein